MLNWLRGKKRTAAVPDYSSLKGLPSPALPDESEAVEARRGAIERELLHSSRRPPDDAPLLTKLLVANHGAWTISDSDGEECLLTFGTRFRAADFIRAVVTPGPRPEPVSTSPSQFVRMLGDLRKSGVDSFTIDPCPRCPPSTRITGIRSHSLRVPGDVIRVWAIGESIQSARIEFYVGRALEWARDGRLEAARDLALKSVGHVYFEDPRPHLLLGQLAVVLGDRLLLEEAKAFLHYFGSVSWEQRLEDVERIGTCDFSCFE